MKNLSTLASAALLTLTMASCSKESYTFRASSAYHASTTTTTNQPAVVATEQAPTVETPVLTASTEKAVATPTVARKAARTYAAHVKAQPVAAAKAVAPTVADVKAAKATIKAMHKASKKARTSAAADEGKSQLVAALLCFFLGGLGVHDFYLGYIGKGILQIVLSLLVIGFILVIIDLVRILTGSLKPKNGEYTKKL